MVFRIFLSAVTAFGYYNGSPNSWIPLTALVSTMIYMPFHDWVESDRLGEAVTASVLIKFTLSLIGLVSTISGWAAIGLAIYWTYLEGRGAM